MQPDRAGHFLGRGLLAALLYVACAMPVMAAPLHLPAIVEPPSQEHHIGKLIFVQLVTPDIAAAKQFYGELFGWSFRDIQAGGTRYAEAFLDGSLVGDHRPGGEGGHGPAHAYKAAPAFHSMPSIPSGSRSGGSRSGGGSRSR